MNGRDYYNEIDDYAADWIENLIRAGLIPAGDVDRRSIVDVRPSDLRGYRQCHFFAGIAGWPLALALAGWPPDRPVWTGSCPCQPLSQAGKQLGADDERHLWPAFHDLIAECRPPVVFGEQVASALGRAWLAAVRSDLEALGYAFGAADLCAAGVGAPHIRQRLGFGADALPTGWPEGWSGSGSGSPAGDGSAGRVADAAEPGRGAQPIWADRTDWRTAAEPGRLRDAGGLADADDGRQGLVGRCGSEVDRGPQNKTSFGFGWGGETCRPGPLHQPWRDADWLLCRDERWRPVEPGTFPLAHGVPARVGQLRAYGNAIVPPLWAEFIAAYLEARRGLAA